MAIMEMFSTLNVPTVRSTQISANSSFSEAAGVSGVSS